jgi:hypothetical protein
MFSIRSEVPRTARATGRAVSARSTNRPSAESTERKTSQRETSSRVVVAVSLSEGTRNCGGGPGFGPTANVNAPRTGCPSAEITRQKTRYQPSGTLRSGVTSVCGEPGALVGAPLVTCPPAASVTETIAKRGSIGSL